MNRVPILPILGYLGYPLAVAGGVLIFATCSLLTLNMITANMVDVVVPIPASPDFNVAPVAQIGTLTLPSAEPTPAAPAEPESSIVAVPPPDHAVAVAVTAPETSTDFEETSISGRIGRLAVNVRGGPSKDAVKIGVLNAGTPVGIGENVGGWIHVSFSGGDGWVYKSYLETGSSLSIN